MCITHPGCSIDVFDQSEKLRFMEGPEMIIQLRADTIPYYVNGTRPIAFADHTEVKLTLDGMEAVGIIEPVTEATDWAAPLVVLWKLNGKLRIFVDQTRIKKACCSSHPPDLQETQWRKSIMKPCSIAASMPQMDISRPPPPHAKSQHLTKFMKPGGVISYCVLQWGSVRQTMNTIGVRMPLLAH